jgi:hypothetical protein
MIVGMVGLIGSGKDTAADYLVNYHGFRRDSFANTLKDAVAAVFGWDRVLLDGRTKESREWREQRDEWWSTRLGMNITPRWILQYWGTDVCRVAFHDDIWIASLENKMRKTADNIVISDVRFPNEIAAIRSAGGIVVRIKRGEDPTWIEDATIVNKGPTDNPLWESSKAMLTRLNIHSSESSWVGSDLDHIVTNDGTIDELFLQLKSIISPERNTAVEVALDNWHNI